MENQPDTVNVSDIISSINISQDDLNNIKSILDNIPDFSNNMTNVQYFIVLAGLINILNNNIKGSIVELGCNIGGTSIRISKILDLYNSPKTFHVYDTFKGMPAFNQIKDNNINPEFYENTMNCPVSKFAHVMEQVNISRMPIIHQGLFSEINEEEYPNNISFAFFDSHLYDSIYDSFKLIWDKLEVNGIIVIDDYDYEDLPGVKKACIDYFKIINISTKTTYNILYSNYNEIVIQKIYINETGIINTNKILNI